MSEAWRREFGSWVQETRLSVLAQHLRLACHGEIFAEGKPMLQLQLKRASVQLDQQKLLHEPATDERVASYVPTASSALRLHAALDLDAQYLNMNINELEPLLEPWQLSGHAVKPAGLKITSGRLYSARLLQLNLSMALQRTLQHLQAVQQKSFDRSDRPTTEEDMKKVYIVEDRASGIAGGFKTVEDLSGGAKRHTRRTSAGRQSTYGSIAGGGVGILGGGGGGGGLFQHSEHAAVLSSNTARANLALQLVDDRGEMRWSPTVRISLSECRLNAHRVWRRGAAISPHAVLISEVRPNAAAGKSIQLRSNLTLHNTLQCHLYIFLETFHHAADKGNRVWKLIEPGDYYNIPLHLTNQTRMVLRPWMDGLVQPELLSVLDDLDSIGGAAPKVKFDPNDERVHLLHPSKLRPPVLSLAEHLSSEWSTDAQTEVRA